MRHVFSPFRGYQSWWRIEFCGFFHRFFLSDMATLAFSSFVPWTVVKNLRVYPPPKAHAPQPRKDTWKACTDTPAGLQAGESRLRRGLVLGVVLLFAVCQGPSAALGENSEWISQGRPEPIEEALLQQQAVRNPAVLEAVNSSTPSAYGCNATSMLPLSINRRCAIIVLYFNIPMCRATYLSVAGVEEPCRDPCGNQEQSSPPSCNCRP